MRRGLLAIVATAGAALAAAPGIASGQAPPGPDRYAYGPHMMGWGGGWYGMIIGPLVMILVLAAVIAAVVLLVRSVGGGRPPAAPGRTPLDILEERFARGEIDKDEYEERRRVLGR